jgi:hypothetical protein
MFDPADWGLIGEFFSKVFGFGRAIMGNRRGLVVHETSTVVIIRALELRSLGGEMDCAC